ncbi:MAG: T9SS type A sorting domain-containing protein [Bacteroidetes bacterium]|nr:T9SS type A sorting domain-containing protein [Bacteroidota bacterium]
MKRNMYALLTGIMLFMVSVAIFAQDSKNIFPPNYQVDTRIDNMGYWQKCAEAGLVPVEPFAPVPPARYTGSKVLLRGVSVVDSPDVLVTIEPSNSTQSENSIVVNPNNKSMLLNSNNSTPQPSNGTVKGADALSSMDAAATWAGTVEGAGGSNSGDPAAVIDLNGRWFVGYIDNASGQSVSYSDNQGATWAVSKVATGSALNMLDKNHLWVDIGPASPYKGYLYNGWMISNNIFVSRSVTSGTSWSTSVNISAATNAGSHNQGINFKCGPDGDVYAVWSVYDSWPSDEKAIGFNKSADGGATWGTAIRALNNIKGIRGTGSVPQNMRTNSFPSMAVDISNSPYRGTIYVVWTNKGYPGINTGTGTSVYMIKSSDKGTTWSAPKIINSDSTAGKHHYLPWITCDQANGYLSVVFYDNRNCASTEAEAWMAYSTDGGDTFTDLKVSDVAFTPSAIPMMASKYMGDYLAIAAYDGKTFPCWTDTRSGHCLTYVSPIDILIPQASINNTGNILNDTTFGNHNGLMDYGETELIGLKMKNTGTGAADNVSVQLSCDNHYITMLDSVKNYGHFDVGQEKLIPNGYKFKVNDSIQNNEPVMFTVKAKDQNDSITWSTFQITAHAPDVSIVSMTIDDIQPGGNANGRLDPGEEATIMITTKNNGIWDAENVVSNLSSMNSFVTVLVPTYNIGTLHAGETIVVSFPVLVNSAAAIGSAAQMHNVATSKYRVTDKIFNAKIGLIVEDWETGNFSKFPWQFTNTAKPWTIDSNIKYEHNYSARSGVITDNESSGLFVEYNASMDDSISFFKRVSSQPIKDLLKFYIDGAMVGFWSNFVDTTFKRVAYPVMAGPHTFKWVYEKNNATTSGLDASWLDFIVFPPRYMTSASAGGDAEVCAGNTYQLHGMADSYDSLRWTTMGTGQFSNPVTLDPVYTPGTQDIADGMVRLMLTAYGNNSIDTNSMMLMIFTAPTANAGGNGSVCKGLPYVLSASSSTAYATLHWTTSGDGIFSDQTILHPAYTPGAQDILQGSARLKLYATGSVACPFASDSLLLAIHGIPQVDLGKDTTTCAEAIVLLNATYPDATNYLWLPSNKTTPTITVDSTGIGLHSEKIRVFVTDNNGCVGSDSVLVTFRICGGIEELAGVSVQVFPNPNSGMFTLELKTRKPEKLDVSMTSSSGETVYTRPGLEVSGVANEKIDVRGLSQGTYLLQISNGSGKKFLKVVIQK